MKDDNRYKVTFMGQIVAGKNSEQVKQNLAQLFKSSADTIDKLFSGQSMIIKKDISETEAKTYQQAMHKAGAIAVITLLAPVEENYDDLPPPPPAEVTNAAGRLGIAPADQWKIDQVGVRISKPKKVRTRPTPMTDHLQLSPPKSEVGQAKRKLETVDPDISQLNLAETGSQLSNSGSKDKIDVPDVSHLDLAATGETIGQAKQIKEFIEPDISQYTIATVGTEIGQLKKQKKLLNPDISHLNIVDD